MRDDKPKKKGSKHVLVFEFLYSLQNTVTYRLVNRTIGTFSEHMNK